MGKKVVTTIKVISVITIFTAALFLLQMLLMPKFQHGIVEGSMIEEYYKDESTHEIIFIGDCELYENISPVTLYENFGYTSYIRGSAQQLPWQSYYLLEDTLRYETPKVVVFNVLSLKYDKPQSETYNRMSIDGMKWSSSKIDCINASMTEDESFIEYVFPILRYHDRWSELENDDFNYLFNKDLVTHNGYYMRCDVKPQTGFPSPTPLTDYTLGSNAMYYLDRMTEICKENGINLILIKAPTEFPYWYPEWDAQIVKYAENHNLTYVNYIPLQGEIGLDMSVDTYDAGLHLNNSGAEKFTMYLGNTLFSDLGLTDYRDNETISSVWQDKIVFYNEMKEQQLSELEN